MKFGTRWPPVPAGILIGISMLLAFVVAGRGIGASGAMTRFVAWVRTRSTTTWYSSLSVC